MADTPKDPNQWTADDAVALRGYIMANPKFLRALMAVKPKVEGVTMESRAVTGSDLNGFLFALDKIEGMMVDPSGNAESAEYLEG